MPLKLIRLDCGHTVHASDVKKIRRCVECGDTKPTRRTTEVQVGDDWMPVDDYRLMRQQQISDSTTLGRLSCGHTTAIGNGAPKRCPEGCDHRPQRFTEVLLGDQWVPANSREVGDTSPWRRGARAREDGLLIQHAKEGPAKRWWCTVCPTKNRHRCSDMQEVFIQWDEHKVTEQHHASIELQRRLDDLTNSIFG